MFKSRRLRLQAAAFKPSAQGMAPRADGSMKNFLCIAINKILCKYNN